MSTAEATAPDYPWLEHLFGGTVAARQSALVLASYPVLLLLVILSAFIRYLWVALAIYCALLVVLSCAARAFVDRHAAAGAAKVSRGGLSAAAIAAVAPAFTYDVRAAAQGDTECAVCLEALRGGEVARRLPGCAHRFHVGCIDMWLDSHATCPMCRCHVLPQKSDKEPTQPSPTLPPAEAPLPPV